jgi:hypothetical protein
MSESGSAVWTGALTGAPIEHESRKSTGRRPFERMA